MIKISDIIVFNLPNKPFPSEWTKIVDKILNHEKYDSASRNRGFGGKSSYRYLGVLNHVISHHYIEKFHNDNKINFTRDITWNRSDLFDLKINNKQIVQIKSKADRSGFFNFDWAMEIPKDHYEKYMMDPDIFGYIFGITDFKNNQFKLLGYIKSEDFDEKKRLAKYDFKFRDGKIKKRGGSNYFVYSDEIYSMSNYIEEVKKLNI